MKIAFVSDSGTGKNVESLARDGIFSVPLQVSYKHKNFHDLQDMSIEEVYQKMREGHMLATSLPSLGKIEELFQSLKDEGYETIFAVPICTGLSGTINAMKLCAENIGITFMFIDCHVTAVVQEYLIRLAKKLYEDGHTIDNIMPILQDVINSTNTILLPNDLQHLKRGGRLTPLAATLGGLLKIKPILKINQDTQGKIDVVSKVRTMHKAMDEAIEMMKKDGVDGSYDITIAHADDEVEAHILQDKCQLAFPDATHNMILLVSVVGVHTGIGCQCIQYFKKINEEKV